MKRLSPLVLTWLLILAQPSSALMQIAPCNDAANTTATATFSANTTLTWYISGYQITTGGATAATAGAVNATITGLTGGTLNISVGNIVTGNGENHTVIFPTPIPASAINTAVVISVPAIGAGNTHTSCALFGELR